MPHANAVLASKAALLSFVVFCFLTPSFALKAGAQVNWEPVPPPPVNAAAKGWYVEREAIPYAGDLYHPAGARIFFDGYRMIPAGEYDGITLYADTTVEPFSQILVPAGSGMVQPYERLRAGAIAGTTGSATPHFPVETPGTPWDTPATTGRLPRVSVPGRPPEAGYPASVIGPSGAARTGQVEQQAFEAAVESVRRPSKTLGIWVSYDGHRWRSSGESVRLAGSKLRVVGEYRGFPVFGPIGNSRVIYLPGRDGLVAPYERVE